MAAQGGVVVGLDKNKKLEIVAGSAAIGAAIGTLVALNKPKSTDANGNTITTQKGFSEAFSDALKGALVGGVIAAAGVGYYDWQAHRQGALAATDAIKLQRARAAAAAAAQASKEQVQQASGAFGALNL